MKEKIRDYSGQYRVLTYASNEKVKEDLIKDSLDYISIEDCRLMLYPDKQILTEDASIIDKLQYCNDYDVFELWDNGTLSRYYDADSIENCFFTTGKCNSNCIMCPSPMSSRTSKQDYNVEHMIEIAKHIPSDAKHLTITGGEPFMLGEEIFKFFYYLKNKFIRTDFLLLTNGRIFVLNKYTNLLIENKPNNIILGIPLHGSTPEIHDHITQTKGSFKQTLDGIKHLLRKYVHIELRIVVNKLNAHDLLDLAKLITKELSQVDHVCIMAMEMTGNAYFNRDKVWVSYKTMSKKIKEAVMELINHGVNVCLYNFPLCTVDSSLWTICEKSISPQKVCYAAICENCSYRGSCGGVFAGTIRYEQNELTVL